jgi:hypothetical protein
MSDAPERIWALADRRKHWQAEPPLDGQHEWHWTEYVRATRIAALEAARAELASVTTERDRLRGILQDIASSGRCDFATVRTALQQKTTSTTGKT